MWNHWQIMLMILLLLQSVAVSAPSKLHPCSWSQHCPLKLLWQFSQVHSCNNLYNFLVGLDFGGLFVQLVFDLNFLKLTTWLFFFLRVCTLSKLLRRPVHLTKEIKTFYLYSGTEGNPRIKKQVTSFTWPSAYKDWNISIIRLMKKRQILQKIMSIKIQKRWLAKKCMLWVRFICHNLDIDIKTCISLKGWLS